MRAIYRLTAAISGSSFLYRLHRLLRILPFVFSPGDCFAIDTLTLLSGRTRYITADICFQVNTYHDDNHKGRPDYVHCDETR